MLLLAYGDPHGEYGPLRAALAEQRPDCIVLLGDLSHEKAPIPLHKLIPDVVDTGIPLFWISGNHEDDTPAHYAAVFEGKLADRCLNGRVVDVDGVRLAGLGGVFRGRVWHPHETSGQAPLWCSREDLVESLPGHKRWKKGLPLKHRATIFPEDFERLRMQRCDVLFSHEAPASFMDQRAGRTTRGFREIDLLASEMGARLIVWGHHHFYEEAETLEGIRTYGTRLATAHWIKL